MLELIIPQFGYDATPVLQNIKSSFDSSKTFGIVGLNGAGKTTLFKLMAGLLKDETCFFGEKNKRFGFQDVAYVDTELYFYPHLTAHEFLSVFSSENKNYNETGLAELFRLPLEKLISDYSTGMKKKLMLMSQIKQNKSVFILDEPFNGLDLETNKLLEVIIRSLNARGKTIFISSHILDPLLNVCSEIHLLKNGTIEKKFEKNDFSNVHSELFGDYLTEVEQELKKVL
jgi:ABC-2 type transport system ATP-binding protein